ncbi:DNA repair protein RecN [Novosphingobium umbonatum]|uniref:DNA repair protein RecN n=1 Tax=Novosphingobium umbonatum TaxID=1908524 RepID=A0A437MX41_9SPHN|nr:DNA repair protein RecN [Novosphingobium umbonatum]RVU02231.1 DNA repair protein RecN [Novosphingobium umbonatum]
MLSHLSIRNIVLIEALDLDFAPGLGVLTGETGAGKSILLDALGLVLGMRADSGLVRAGTDLASVTASFEAGALDAAVADALAEAGVEIEPGEPILIRRQIKADGGSKAFINDRPASVALLRELAPYLVEIHGQHDDRGLVNPRGHRSLLDRYARVDTAALEAAWRTWRQAGEKLAARREAIAKAAEDRELLMAHAGELEALAPEAGEEEELAAERATMQKGARLSGDLADLQQVFAGSNSVLAQLRQAARRLDRIAGEHPLLEEVLGALDRAVIEADDAEDKLGRALDALAHDPMALDRVETRLFELRAAARKHGCAVEDLPRKAREMREALNAIEGGEAEVAGLEAAEKAARAAWLKLAEAASAARGEAAGRLDAAVKGELAPLKLDAARFRTQVTPLEESQWGGAGMDRVEFMIATNPGADFAPLAKIASGGELSRFILALKVALAEEGGAATMIFDEIDRGVGGAVAQAIGERLARLASTGQLLAVTHSPQVAARGGQHYFIAKSNDGTVTRTGVVQLDGAGRQQEIARMLSGSEITPEARAQAERLLEGA